MIQEIIDLEWQFLQLVNHIDGRADCQDDYHTFYIMRNSQFSTWDIAVLSSYLQDLKQYQMIGRNPIREKYGYMMQSSDPEYYLLIKDTLPTIETSQKELIEMIITIQLDWKIDFHNRYPILDNNARIIFSKDDSIEETSFETYLRGELATYSPKTLYLYGQMIVNMAQKNQNLTELIMKHTVKAYGYETLQQAQNAIQKD